MQVKLDFELLLAKPKGGVRSFHSSAHGSHSKDDTAQIHEKCLAQIEKCWTES